MRLYTVLALCLACAACAPLAGKRATGVEDVVGEQVFCTMDAKQCMDGSFVGRVPPDCDWAPCPPPF